MNKKIVGLIVVAALLLGAGGFALITNNKDGKKADPEVEIPENSNDGEDITQAQLAAGITARQAEFDAEEYEMPEKEKFTYTINDDGTTEPEMTDLDKDMWGLIEEMSPSQESFDSIREYTVYYDEDDTTDASVSAIDDNDEEWSFELNYSSTNDFELLLPVIVHEFSHVLSLQNDEVTSETEEREIRNTCVNYLVAEGCLKDGTMLNNFFEKFWKENPDFVPDVDRAENETEAFYETRQDQYVTDYATTNPIEDFAESIMFYVMNSPVKANTEKRQKTDFFKGYNKLVRYRNEVREKIANFS